MSWTLALKKTAATDAGWLSKFAAWLIKARLVSQYCHGGIVIYGKLYHVTAKDGLCCCVNWSPERWDLFEIEGSGNDALDKYRANAGARYDWLSLLTFVGIRASDEKRFYCYEWCWLAMTGVNPNFRVTPERLLTKINLK